MQHALFFFLKNYFFLFVGCSYLCAIDEVQPFRLGVENISLEWLQRELGVSEHIPRVGLVANQTSQDQSRSRTLDILRAKNIDVRIVFAPEHGFTGAVPAGLTVNNEQDSKTNVAVVSLYKQGAGKTVDPQSLADLDCVIYDLQDCGMRHYTYISTLLRVMEGCLAAKKPLVILDRPNPLGGMIEGPLVDEGLISFISIAPIPLRHGLTVGELARYFNHYVLKYPVQLFVVQMSGYNKNTHKFKLLAALSPNIQSIQSVYGYSFLGLLGEVAPFDVGVGTSHAFQMIGLPKKYTVRWPLVQSILREAGIQSQVLTYSVERKKEEYQGVRLNISDIDKLQAFPLLLKLLAFFEAEGVKLAFSPMFDKAIGAASVRQSIIDRKPFGAGFVAFDKARIQFFRKALVANCIMYRAGC